MHFLSFLNIEHNIVLKFGEPKNSIELKRKEKEKMKFDSRFFLKKKKKTFDKSSGVDKYLLETASLS